MEFQELYSGAKTKKAHQRRDFNTFVCPPGEINAYSFWALSGWLMEQILWISDGPVNGKKR